MMALGLRTMAAMTMAVRLRSSALMTWQTQPPAGSPTMMQ